MQMAVVHSSLYSNCRRLRKYIDNFSRAVQKWASPLSLQWEPVVGLEVHAQIAAKSKLFSGAAKCYAASANTQVAFFDAGLPGTLPVINRTCVEAGALSALALGCTIHKKSMFDRKHYFYADLPVGYQITQQRHPLATTGAINFVVCNSAVAKRAYLRKVQIKQIQLEQDSGKSLHDEEAGYSLIDLNRAGVALMEIVFDPDLKNGEEAAALVKELILILKRLGTCDCKMEEGSLRVDANISVHRPFTPLGVRTEVKNLNSVRAVASAVDFEIHRQIKLLEDGGEVINETRTFDPELKETYPMRDKESKQDYRYMPEPNLPPIILVDEWDPPETSTNNVEIDTLRRQIPELPHHTREYLISRFGLTLETSAQLVNDLPVLKLFYGIMEHKNLKAMSVVDMLFNDLYSLLNKAEIELDECSLTAERLADLLELKASEAISPFVAKQVLEMMFQGDLRTPKEIVHDQNWTQINVKEELELFCDQVLSANSKLVASYLAGKEKNFNKLVNLVRKESKERANMAMVATILKKRLLEIKQKEM